MRGLLVAFLLAAAVLAGCSGAPDTEPAGRSTGPGAHGMHEAATHILGPEWQVGDYWTLESPQQDSGPFTHVVSGESGDDWLMDTDSPVIAYFDARFDISLLGKVRKSDLAGSQGSTRVEFLKFPLSTGLNWTTTWDGETMRVHAVDVKDGKALLQATRANGTLYADYTYDSKVGYFSQFRFYLPDGVSPQFEWTLRQSGSGFAAPLMRWTLETLFSTTGPIPSGSLGSFFVEPVYTDIWIDSRLDCLTGAVALAVGPFTGPAEDRGYSATGPCPIQAQDAYAIASPAQAEQWGAALTTAPTTSGTLDLAVFGRTAVQFNAGQAPA